MRCRRPWQYRLQALSARLNNWMLTKLTKEVENTAGVSPLVVVPRHKLHEVGVQGDTSLGIEDRGVCVADKVRGNNLILGIGKNS